MRLCGNELEISRRYTFATPIAVNIPCMIATGRVQGVGFRYYMAFKAQQFQITGWVRNRRDGSVEAMIQGTPENVAAMIERAQRGPRGSVVTSVDINEDSGIYTTFVTLPTA